MSKVRRLHVVLILAVCALLAQPRAPIRSDFSIGGVELGMTRVQVENVTEPGSYGAKYQAKATSESRLNGLDDADLRVHFDDQGKVVRVSGARLEHLGETICATSGSEGDYVSQVQALLGKPLEGWPPKQGDLSHSFFFPEQHLIVQMGCSGWYFSLGQRRNPNL